MIVSGWKNSGLALITGLSVIPYSVVVCIGWGVLATMHVVCGRRTIVGSESLF